MSHETKYGFNEVKAFTCQQAGKHPTLLTRDVFLSGFVFKG